MQNSLPEQKSADRLAFEHYLRTGQRLTTAQFIEECEKKFNPYHDELGRFTFGLGLSGGGGSSRNGNSNKPASSGSVDTWTDELRSIFESNPETRPAVPSAPQPTVKIGPIAEIPGYPQAGKTNWRSSNDLAFAAAADFYNRRYKLKQGDQGFKTPEFMKAWAMIESGVEGSKNAFLSDPFQVNNPGDWVPEKLQRFGLRKHQTLTPAASAFAALEWLRIKSRVHDGRGGVRILGDEGALERYNGNRVKTRQSGELLHSQWYAATILQMAQQAGRARK